MLIVRLWFERQKNPKVNLLKNIWIRNDMEADYIRRWRQKGNAGYVSTLYHCPTEKATDLCIYDINDKLKSNNTYDIGGTYTQDDAADFWFYYSTSLCHGYNYLLNLFVLPRKPSNFSVIVPRPNKISNEIKENDEKIVIVYGPQTELTFRTTRKDEPVFVTTLRFDANEVNSVENAILLVPILIQQHTKLQLDQNIVRTIKLRHNLSPLMSQNETKDFALISSSGKQYPVHKVLVAAHSPILRLKLHSPERSLALDVSDEAMEILIEFLYTGTLSNLHKQDFMMLLGIAEGLQLSQLLALAQQLLGEEINVNNAVSIAGIAKQYNLEKLTLKVFDFIKLHPEVMSTDGWHSLDDIDLVKQLLKYIHPSVNNLA